MFATFEELSMGFTVPGVFLKIGRLEFGVGIWFSWPKDLNVLQRLDHILMLEMQLHAFNGVGFSYVFLIEGIWKILKLLNLGLVQRRCAQQLFDSLSPDPVAQQHRELVIPQQQNLQRMHFPLVSSSRLILLLNLSALLASFPGQFFF